MATSRSLNKVLLIGNLTRNPILRTTSNSATVATFGVATNDSWKDASGNLQERTEFHNVVAWNKLAEICAQILATGTLVWIEGELRTRTWEDGSGNRRYKTEIKINDMKLLDDKGKKGVGIDAAREAGENADEEIEDIADGAATMATPPAVAEAKESKPAPKKEKEADDSDEDDSDKDSDESGDDLF